jgi:hypothetical protein
MEIVSVAVSPACMAITAKEQPMGMKPSASGTEARMALKKDVRKGTPPFREIDLLSPYHKTGAKATVFFSEAKREKILHKISGIYCQATKQML